MTKIWVKRGRRHLCNNIVIATLFTCSVVQDATQKTAQTALQHSDKVKGKRVFSII